MFALYINIKLRIERIQFGTSPELLHLIFCQALNRTFYPVRCRTESCFTKLWIVLLLWWCCSAGKFSWWCSWTWQIYYTLEEGEVLGNEEYAATVEAMLSMMRIASLAGKEDNKISYWRKLWESYIFVNELFLIK